MNQKMMRKPHKQIRDVWPMARKSISIKRVSACKEDSMRDIETASENYTPLERNVRWHTIEKGIAIAFRTIVYRMRRRGTRAWQHTTPPTARAEGSRWRPAGDNCAATR
ncbi:hypothetical protein [Caballeronia humi]|uniref:hypothetical protein n=1 Tax=Caballeronia humi TaxID=326474 RepID=UPI000F73645B|nr:hypothetical protein [Caballeronia humi]